MHCLFKNIQFVIEIHSSNYCTQPMKALSTCSLDNLKTIHIHLCCKIINVIQGEECLWDRRCENRPAIRLQRHPVSVHQKKAHHTSPQLDNITMLSQQQLTTHNLTAPHEANTTI